MENNKKCNWFDKFDWKFWILVITILLSVYKSAIVDDVNIKTLQTTMDKMSVQVGKNSLLIERIDERTKYIKIP